jgi:hypothetical protein
MAWELCSKEEVVSLHPFPVDDLKDFWSDLVEDMIREHMGTPNLGQSVVLTNETHDGDGTNLLIVREPPIISVEELRIHGVASIPADFVSYANRIELVAENFPEGVLNVQIDYTSGDLTVAPKVKGAAAAMIAAIINYRQRYGADSTIKWASNEDIKAGESTPNLNVGLTSHLMQIMKRMLRREKIRAS